MRVWESKGLGKRANGNKWNGKTRLGEQGIGRRDWERKWGEKTAEKSVCIAVIIAVVVVVVVAVTD